MRIPIQWILLVYKRSLFAKQSNLMNGDAFDELNKKHLMNSNLEIDQEVAY